MKFKIFVVFEGNILAHPTQRVSVMWVFVGVGSRKLSDYNLLWKHWAK